MSFDLPTVQGGTAPFAVSCTPAPATSFAIGSTAVTCSVSDAAGQSAACAFEIIVGAAPRLAVTRLVAFGDSLTEGVVSAPLAAFGLSATQSYPSRLAGLIERRYLGQTFTIVNAGRGGEQAAEGITRLPMVLSEHQPEVLLLLEGANDLIWWGTAVPGVRRAADAVEELVKEARRRNVRVLLATLPPWRQGGPKQLDASLPLALNDEIVRIARNKGADLVDLYGAMIAEVDTLIGRDGLHPTEAGYGRMAEAFFNAIQAAFELPAPGGGPASR